MRIKKLLLTMEKEISKQVALAKKNNIFLSPRWNTLSPVDKYIVIVR